jgi:anti-anti-sigma factor
MRVSSSVDGDTVRIKVTGELDALSVVELVPTLDTLLAQPQQRWVFDLGELRIIDGSGVGAIIYAFRKLRQRGGSMTLEGAKDQPLSVLRLMRLDQVLGR